jgi:hypothetical protein
MNYLEAPVLAELAFLRLGSVSFTATAGLAPALLAYCSVAAQTADGFKRTPSPGLRTLNAGLRLRMRCRRARRACGEEPCTYKLRFCAQSDRCVNRTAPRCPARIRARPRHRRPGSSCTRFRNEYAATSGPGGNGSSSPLFRPNGNPSIHFTGSCVRLAACLHRVSLEPLAGPSLASFCSPPPGRPRRNRRPYRRATGAPPLASPSVRSGTGWGRWKSRFRRPAPGLRSACGLRRAARRGPARALPACRSAVSGRAGRLLPL